LPFRGSLPRALALLAALGVALSACATTVPRPRIHSAEYVRSWGLAAINANPAYRAGATGRGVTIAMIDCGLEQAQPELRRNVSPRSVDLMAGLRRVPVQERHGDYVAGPLGSALDGRGLVGVAYNATLLSVRADFDGGLNGECAFRPSDLARGLDYATRNGARIVVLPLQGKRALGAPFEAALKRTVDAGVAVVIAAGNDAAGQPSYPGRYASDPRFAGSIIAVGAFRADGSLAPWSNRAGDARRYFVAAPGEGVITDCGSKWCKRISGTSMAAPFVGGALALLMEARPALDGRGAIQALIGAARDAGEPGVDEVYGAGLLNVGQAFQLHRAAAPTAPARLGPPSACRQAVQSGAADRPDDPGRP
jgi:subtilisin family serine protease